jgi:hypothetical protein
VFADASVVQPKTDAVPPPPSDAAAPLANTEPAKLVIDHLSGSQALALQEKLSRFEKMKSQMEKLQENQPLSLNDTKALELCEREIPKMRMELADRLLGYKIDPALPPLPAEGLADIDKQIVDVSAKVTARVEATAPKPKIGIDADDPGANPALGVGGNNPALAVGGSNPTLVVGGNNPTLAVGGNNPALAVGGSAPAAQNNPAAPAAPTGGTTLTTPNAPAPGKGLNVGAKSATPPQFKPGKGPDTSWEGLMERFLEMLFTILFNAKNTLKKVGGGIIDTLKGGFQFAGGALGVGLSVAATPFVGLYHAVASEPGQKWQNFKDSMSKAFDTSVNGKYGLKSGLGDMVVGVGGILKGVADTTGATALASDMHTMRMTAKALYEKEMATADAAKPASPAKPGTATPGAATPGAATPGTASPGAVTPGVATPTTATAAAVGTPAAPNTAQANQMIAVTQNAAAQNTNGVAQIQPAPQTSNVAKDPIPDPALQAHKAQQPSMAEIQAQAVARAQAEEAAKAKANEDRIKAQIAANEAAGIPPPPPPEAGSGTANKLHGPS